MHNSVNIPRPEHPNPQWERKNWVNLNGTWDFEIDNACSGEFRGLIQAPSLSGTITVPFCPECKASGVENKDFENAISAIYKTFVDSESANR